MCPDPSSAKPGKGGFAPRLPPLNNKTAKIHRLEHLLKEAMPGLGIRQMAASLGVDERTVKRYLAELRRLKFDVVQDRPSRGRPALYHIRSEGVPPTHFLPGLKKIRAELHAGGNPKYSALITQLVRYLEEKEGPAHPVAEGRVDREAGAGREALASRGPSEIYHIDHGPFAEADPHPGILKIVENAIAARTALRVTYSGYARDAGEFIFYPYILCLRVGTLYLIGRQGENRGPFKSLSVKRIKRCLATPDVFSPDPFNAADYYKYTFGQWARQLNENPETVLLALRAPWLEKFLSESHFNPPGKIVRKGKESFFELKMVIKPDFVNWVLSLAPDLAPVKPESLRKEVTERLRKALEAFDISP
jgi:predicted DNA-binding transcriptional regulator YafY